MVLVVLMGQTQVAEQIRDFRPDLAEVRVARIASAIEAASRYHGQDPMLLAAIVRVESSFGSGAKACWPAPWKGLHARTCDYGIAQINELWVRHWNLDPVRLQNDDLYNLMVAARILADLQKRFERREPGRWFTRYHSGTPSRRKVYAARLMRSLEMEAVAARQSTGGRSQTNDPVRPLPDQRRVRQQL